MDSPWVLALIAFFGIFLMFVIISLLADLLIIGTAVGCAAAAYFLPSWYPLFYDFVQNTQLPIYLGLTAPLESGGLEQATLYAMMGLIILLGTLICIPALPFSGTYRFILGANSRKITKSDENYIRDLVRSEIYVQEKNHLESQPQPASAPQAKAQASVKNSSRRPPLPPKTLPPEPPELELELEPQIEIKSKDNTA